MFVLSAEIGAIMRRSIVALVVVALGSAALLGPSACARAAGAETMQAMVLSDGRLVMQSLPLPQPAAGEVRIEVRAAGINPADWKMARMAKRLGPRPILGLDAAGTISAVGPSVTRWKRGDAVIALTRPPHGAYAQQVVVSTDFIAAKPRSMSFEEAAGIPVAGVTAWRSLIDVASLRKGQRVLVEGGAGGVGSAAVQIAKAEGAYVIATASPRHAAFLRSIGADEVIDYTAGPFERRVKDIDVALDTVSPDDGLHALATLRPNGVLVTVVGPLPPERCAAAHVRCVAPGSSGGQPAAPYLQDIDRLVDAGKYRVSVERALPLAEAAAAWQSSRGGHTQGKLVLTMPR
jgi:NADPH:quinone reductase-like Zn-dependent oxidoreductase